MNLRLTRITLKLVVAANSVCGVFSKEQNQLLPPWLREVERKTISFCVFYSDVCERAHRRWGVKAFLLDWQATVESRNP